MIDTLDLEGAMSDGRDIARAFWISLLLAVLAWVVVAGVRPQSVAPGSTACSSYKGQTSEGYERNGSTLFLRLPGGGTVTLQNFSNGAGGIMLTTRPVDPSRALAEVKC